MSATGMARTALRWYDDPSARPNPQALAEALRGMVAAEDARLRDLAIPDSAPEDVITHRARERVGIRDDAVVTDATTPWGIERRFQWWEVSA